MSRILFAGSVAMMAMAILTLSATWSNSAGSGSAAPAPILEEAAIAGAPPLAARAEEDSTGAAAEPLPLDESAVQEIFRMRQKLGMGELRLADGLTRQGETAGDPFLGALRDVAGVSEDPAPPLAANGIEATASPSGESLRAAARRLDEIAADLEDAAHYEQADQIRKVAQNLRLRKRKLDRQ